MAVERERASSQDYLTMQDALAKLQHLEARAVLSGGIDKIKKRQEQGKLTARQRISLLVDDGAFVELNMLAEHQGTDFDMERIKVPGDGVVTGFGRIDGREVFVFAQDATFLAGSLGLTHVQKICYLIDKARTTGRPIIGLYESAGGRIQDATHVIGRGELFYKNSITSGIVPQISAIMGTCVGGAVYSPALTDFVIMIEGGSQMFITGPPVIKAVTGEEITQEELGGARVHAEVTGTADLVASDEVGCLAMIRRLLSYLPSNNLDEPPYVDTGDDPTRLTPELEELVPSQPNIPFDMKEVIGRIVDRDSFFEIKGGYARNIIVGFARFSGEVVGIVANQPMVMAGSLDVDASDKASRFIWLCDAYNIPLVTLVDVPGYLPGVRQEHSGIIRHGAKMLYAYSSATVPKVTVIIRKAYGGAIPAMCSKQLGCDVMYAWPIAEFAVMGAEAAVNVLYRREIERSGDPEALRKKRVAEYRERFLGPFDAAAKRYIDGIIRPCDTRRAIIGALAIAKGKRVDPLPRKHGIPPQ